MEREGIRLVSLVLRFGVIWRVWISSTWIGLPNGLHATATRFQARGKALRGIAIHHLSTVCLGVEDKSVLTVIQSHKVGRRVRASLTPKVRHRICASHEMDIRAVPVASPHVVGDIVPGHQALRKREGRHVIFTRPVIRDAELVH